ncbi:unnamed protein product [Anisakis simplex]|uniref:TRM13 domain-containing protein n=1 Tax=Anisakis simplex TaxID=6269 RepID=A0A0M3JCR3_ANISI|nr:unnamed protein product [Anisakis simplex]
MKTSGYKANKIGSVSSLWTREDKQNLGCMAKVLLELGRAEYLQSLGYKISVYRYVDFCLSPENLLIVGTRYDNADLSV